MTNNNNGIWNELPKELYVIGDIHGDFYAFQQVLELTKCFDIKNNKELITMNNDKMILKDGCKDYNITWNKNKKNCMIILAGDAIDRCRNINNLSNCINTVADEDCDYEILKLIFDLDIEAKKYNSRIILVLGNHEIMNLKKNFTYVSKKGKLNNDRVKNIQKIIKKNIDNVFGIIRINKYVIVHGGINPLFFTKKNKDWNNINIESIEHFNNEIKAQIMNDFKNDDDELKNNSFDMNVYINPFWDRSLGLEKINDDCKKIYMDNILQIKDLTILNDLQIIIAHCPQKIISNNIEEYKINHINCFEHKIWRIDVSMSRGFDSYDESKIFNIDITKKFDFNDFYNVKKRKNISILKISNVNNIIVKLIQLFYNKIIGNENIISGISTLEYFYDNVFTNDYQRYYYLLQDIEEHILTEFNDNLLNIEFQTQDFKNKLDDITKKKKIIQSIMNSI